MELARIEYEATPESMLGAAMHGYVTNPAIRRQHRAVQAYLVLAAVCAGVLIGTITAAGKSPGWTDVVIGALAGVPFLLAALLLPTALRVSTRKSLAGTYRGRAFRPLLGRYRVVVSEDGIEAGTPAAFLRCRWGGVIGITDRDEYIFIQLTAFFVSVPRSSFSTEDEFNGFVELVRRRIPVDQ